MGIEKTSKPLYQIKELVFGFKSRGARLQEHGTREGETEITLTLDPETYNAYKDIKVVILRKKNGVMTLIERETSIDSTVIGKVRQIIAEANKQTRNGVKSCGGTI